jgi:formylglycine-generating enzyme required for sulfatase activity
MNDEYNSIGDDHTMKPDPMDLSMGDAPTVRGSFTTKRFRIGDVILNRYRITGELGQGGMGVVYKCFDETSGIEVALKSLPPELSHDSNEMEEVRENFQLVAKLVHTNIAQIRTLEKDQHSGDYYLIMELVEGVNLRKWRKTVGRLPSGGVEVESILPIARQVAGALDYAHSQGVMHRDVKPSNIMVGGQALGIRQGAIGNASESSVPSLVNNLSIKVLDFGLAAQIHTSLSRVSQVRHGTSVTGPYMAPEQWRGQYQDAATDQYALAAMIYELLTGRPPFESHDPTVLREAVLNEAVEKPEHITPVQWKVLQRGLAKDRKARFGSCGEFVAALGGGKVKPRNTPNTRNKTANGRRSTRIGIGLLLAGILAGGVYFGVRWLDTAFKARARQEQHDAKEQAQISALLYDARSALNTGNLDGATENAQAVLKLNKSDVEALSLLAEVETKAGERKAREVKVDASMAFEQLERDIPDRGQGFDREFAELKKELLIALDAHESQSWGQAFTAFKGALGGCDALRALDDDRNDAKAQRTAADNQQTAAKSAKADELAKKEWDAALGTDRRAVRLFDEGKFKEASKAWQAAAREYGAAKTFAVAVTEYQAAKKKWDEVVAAIHDRGARSGASATEEELRQYALTEWTAADKAARLGAAAAAEPARGRQHYEAALAKYALAVKAAQPFLIPQLKVVCSVVGVESVLRTEPGGSALRADATTWKLDKSKSYSLTVSAPGYKTHTETLTANWNGLKAMPIALEKRSGPEEGQAWTSPSAGMEFVWIDALKGWVGKYEVTNGEYRKKESGHTSKEYEGHSLNGDRQPAVYVNFDDAQAYAKWLTQRDRATGHLPDGYAYRLPTKDEFTAFAQCGDGREYPWGNNWPPPNDWNYHGSEGAGSWSKIDGHRDSYPVTGPVENSGKNPWGVYGVGGNVWECTTERAGGSFDAWRGASWAYDSQRYLRCSFRYDYNASHRHINLGFRLVLFRPGQN